MVYDVESHGGKPEISPQFEEGKVLENANILQNDPPKRKFSIPYSWVDTDTEGHAGPGGW